MMEWRDANHLDVAFWLVNMSMQLVLDCTSFIVANREAVTTIGELKGARTAISITTQSTPSEMCSGNTSIYLQQVAKHE